MALGMEVGLGPGHIVLDVEPSSPSQKGDRGPQFPAHFYCCQTAGWIKMPLSTEVGLSSGDIVFDRDPAPTKKGHSLPIFSPCLLWPKNCDFFVQDKNCFECTEQLRDI